MIGRCMELNVRLCKIEIADGNLPSCGNTILPVEGHFLPEMPNKVPVAPKTKVIAHVVINILADQFERKKSARWTVRVVGCEMFHTERRPNSQW